MSARRIIRVADLSNDEVTKLLDRAREFCNGSTSIVPQRQLGMVFLEASLRTRLGFAAAAHRLGWSVLEVDERRSSTSSMPESWQDTLRVVGGYSDVVVARLGREVEHGDLDTLSVCPLVNGGGRGSVAEHPSQALIDYFAMEMLVGPVASLDVVVCGDLRMRASRSLLALLARKLPRRLTVVTVGRLRSTEPLPAALRERTRFAALEDAAAEADVIHVLGIPHQAVSEADRTRLRLDDGVLAKLRPGAVVLSPMPVIDEIAQASRYDLHVRMHEQSDLGVFVRMALLEMLAAD